MLMSRDYALAWKRPQEPRPQTPIEDPNTWHTYTKRLYQVPNQMPIMIGHTLAKLYVEVIEAELNDYMETLSFLST